jgi:hypothetical protein
MLAFAPAALADTESVRDPLGETGFFLDMDRLRVNNGKAVLTAVAHAPGLRKRWVDSVTTAFDTGANGGVYWFTQSQGPGTPSRLYRTKVAWGGEGLLRRCHGIGTRYSDDRGTVRVRVPQRCLGRHAGSVRSWFRIDHYAADNTVSDRVPNRRWVPRTRRG